jgi:16S rRNA (cytidine1402-2'-O)-methyltransferase
MTGTLYLVATPIGNLEDASHRAVRILREVDLVACEDTRQTRKLLAHYDIRTPTLSYHEHNEARRTPELIDRLLAGADIALVSDAGMPLVSDPGLLLVKATIARGIRVVPIPGPSAAIAALAASGLPTEPFYFAGFLPAKAAQRRKTLQKLAALECTLVLFEAPHRILDALTDIEAVLAGRHVVLARELTKIHEEFLRGTASSIRADLEARGPVHGEITLVIGPPPAPAKTEADAAAIRARIEQLEREGLTRMEAIKAAARELGLPKREVYRIAEQL